MMAEDERVEARRWKVGVLMRGMGVLMREVGTVMRNLEALRRKMLGDLGEELGMEALVEKGYGNVENLNRKKNNFKFADLYAEKDGERFVISVKARNKYQKDGKTLNAYYNITRSHRKEAEEKHKAKARWLVVQFTSFTYTIYFGCLEELEGRNSVPMRKCACGKVGKCLVEGREHGLDFDFLTNERK